MLKFVNGQLLLLVVNKASLQLAVFLFDFVEVRNESFLRLFRFFLSFDERIDFGFQSLEVGVKDVVDLRQSFYL